MVHVPFNQDERYQSEDVVLCNLEGFQLSTNHWWSRLKVFNFEDDNSSQNLTRSPWATSLT